MTREEKKIDGLLKEYIEKMDIHPEEERLEQTIRLAEKAFYQSSREQPAAYLEFLFRQAAYIRKRWWLFQFLTLCLLWWILYMAEGNYYVQRSMGVLAPAFVILVIPELWKNRSSGSMEVEGAAFYSLRQIYSARLLLFGMVDVFFLSIFFVAVSATVRMTAWEMLIQFFLPFNVTCCICFSVLCSRSCGTEYIAVVLSLLWIALWILIVLDEKIYSVISRPVWGLVLVGTVCYMAAAVERIRRSCGNYQEGKALWN